MVKTAENPCIAAMPAALPVAKVGPPPAARAIT